MSVIFILIPLSIVIAACFLGAFIWAVRSGQYEDMCTPAMRVLLEDATQIPGSARAPRAANRALVVSREAHRVSTRSNARARSNVFGEGIETQHTFE
ncbi:MAG: cbb3-type cytochrome oxidase assembly protein CcoS [Verrucomicrobiales bacterium]|nr:cbb3-type cytochrome oxidase assembly protein CcoS [Verrucomicrobiales bacterium]